jgi:hypothetical protein
MNHEPVSLLRKLKWSQKEAYVGTVHINKLMMRKKVHFLSQVFTM